MRNRVLRAARFVGAVAGILALAACGAIPSGGGVIAGPAVDDSVESDIINLPQGPVAGSEQEQILADFIAAATGPQNNYAVARLFLSREFEPIWQPNSSVTIRQGATSTERTADTALDYTFSSAASVDSTGAYSASTSPRPQTLTYQFVQENGEWRISEAPQGVILSTTAFDQIFQAHALYFFDPTFTYLVPDLRWFPSRGTLSNRIVQELLAGQSPWLTSGATVSSFPEGTQLVRVSTENGVASVDLSQEALGANSTDTGRMLQQLTSSLVTIPSIQNVRMTVDDLPFGTSDDSAVKPDVSVDFRPLVVTDGQFGFAAGGTVSTIGQLSAKVIDLGALAVTLANDQQSAAVLAPGGVWAVRTGDTPPVLVDSRQGLIAPSIDTARYIWSVPSGSPSSIRVFELDGTAHDVASAVPADGRIVSLEVSRDGARVVIGLDTPAGPRLSAYAILRDAETGLPESLGVELPLPVSVGTITDVTWIDETTIGVLSLDVEETMSSIYVLGGQRSVRATPGAASTMVGGNNGVSGAWVLRADGTVLTPRANGWLDSGLTASVLATQQ